MQLYQNFGISGEFEHPKSPLGTPLQRSNCGVNLTPHLHLVPILRLSEPIPLLPLTPWWRVLWLHYLCFSLKISNFFTAGASEWYILGVWQKDFVHFFFLCMWARQLQGGQCVIHRDILQFVPTRHHTLGFLHLHRSRSKINISRKLANKKVVTVSSLKLQAVCSN